MDSGHPWPSVLRTAGRTGAQIGSPADLSNPGGLSTPPTLANRNGPARGPFLFGGGHSLERTPLNGFPCLTG
jgi:hypothetical protein